MDVAIFNGTDRDKWISDLNQKGYTKITTMPRELVDDTKKKTRDFLKSIKYSTPNRELHNLINSEHSIKLESNKIVDSYLNEFLKSYLNLDLIDLLPVSHIVKPFGLKSNIWHQDSSIVDERKHFSFNAWMPLVDTNKLNGCMWFLPGSHRTNNVFRQFGFNPFYGKFLKEFKKYLIPLDVKAGEVVLFHRSIIHGSSNNYMPWNRIALESVIINKGAQLYNFHREESISRNKVLGYKVDMNHFLSASPKDDFYNNVYAYDEFDDIGMDGIRSLLRNELTALLAV